MKLIGGLPKLVDQHPTLARSTAKQMGIENLDEVISIFRQSVNDPEKKMRLAEFIGYRLTELVKDVITKFGLGKPTPTSQQTVPPQPVQPPSSPGQQPIPFNIGGHLIDPRKPYPVN